MCRNVARRERPPVTSEQERSRHDPQGLRRKRDRPARRDESRRSPSLGGVELELERRVETLRRVAAQRAIAAIVAARVAAPCTRRSGSGSSGKRCDRRQRREDDVARAARAEQPVGERGAMARRRGLRRRPGRSTSLTPLMTTATSASTGGRCQQQRVDAACRQARSSRRSVHATGRPVAAVERAHEVAGDALVLMRDTDAGGRRVAGDERRGSAASRRRRRGPRVRRGLPAAPARVAASRSPARSAAARGRA